jgi:hypothetical protein
MQFSNEALMVARDALDLDEDAAADVMCWSTRFLIPQPSNSQPDQ